MFISARTQSVRRIQSLQKRLTVDEDIILQSPNQQRAINNHVRDTNGRQKVKHLNSISPSLTIHHKEPNTINLISQTKLNSHPDLHTLDWKYSPSPTNILCGGNSKDKTTKPDFKNLSKTFLSVILRTYNKFSFLYCLFIMEFANESLII